MSEKIDNPQEMYPPITTELPSEPPIRVLLHGLLVSAFNKEKQHLEVGALHPVPKDHFLELKVCERSQDRKWEARFPISETDEIELKFNQDDFSDLRKYEPSEVFDPPKANRNDFRWILDFEKEHKSRKLPKIKNRIKPCFYLYNGVVYTMLRSAPLTKDKEEFRQISQVMAVGLTLPSKPRSGLRATLFIKRDGKTHEAFEFDLSKHFNVVFQNVCRKPKLEGGAVDVNQLKDTFDPSPDKHFIFEHAEEDTDKIEKYIRGEIRRMRGRGGKHILNGLNDIYWLPGDASSAGENFQSRVDPCGTGFFGESDDGLV